VHVHNLFPNIGTRWLRQCDIPIVASVHNYRLVCAAATLHREGQTCTLCPDGQPLASLRHACYRSSRAATLPLTIATRKPLSDNPLVVHAARLIVPTQRVADVLTGFGAVAKRIEVCPYIVPSPHLGASPAPREERWVAVGRLQPEKGMLDLVRSWPRGRALDIVGDGDEFAAIAAVRHPDVRMLGQLDPKDLARRLPRHSGLVFPSRWMGNQASIVLEALAAGLPIIYLKGSSAGDSTEDSSAGFEVGEFAEHSWEAAAQAVLSAGEHARLSARRIYEERFSPPAWERRMVGIYEDVAGRGRAGGQPGSG
jgi:glycosyltransferase involved in cell wall biosynthesis